MFRKVLVAIDTSDHSKRALETAARLSSEVHSDLRILHVLETGFGARAGEIELEDRTDVHKLVDEAVAQLSAKGASVTGNVRSAEHGKVARQISHEADEWEADTIVVGTRGLTDVEGMLLGSTTHKLLHISRVPVLVVR